MIRYHKGLNYLGVLFKTLNSFLIIFYADIIIIYIIDKKSTSCISPLTLIPVYLILKLKKLMLIKNLHMTTLESLVNTRKGGIHNIRGIVYQTVYTIYRIVY